MDEIVVKRVGDRTHFLNGVPDRDLTRVEWEQFTPEQQDIILNSLLYEAVKGFLPNTTVPPIDQWKQGISAKQDNEPDAPQQED